MQNERDRLLPLHCMFRMIRSALPEGSKISHEVKLTMLEATSEFIGFLTNHSVEEHMLKAKRKTLLKEDLINSLPELDLDVFGPPLKAYLDQNKNASSKHKRNSSNVSPADAQSED